MPQRLRTHRAAPALLIVALLQGGACSGDPDDGRDVDGDEGRRDPSRRACDLVDAEMVMATFEGTADDGAPGIARNCEFLITGGQVETVSVYYFGVAEDWDGIREGYDENRGGTTDVEGIGNAAFYPNDRGRVELVVRTDDIVFALWVFVYPADTPPGVPEDVVALAQAIVDAN